MKKNKPVRPKKRGKKTLSKTDKTLVYYPKTLFLEDGSLEALNHRINEAELHGYNLSSFERQRDEFFQSYIAIMSRKKITIRTFKKRLS